MHRLRSMLRCATVAALGATALVAGFASPAQAVNSTRADLTSWTYTDSAQPSTPVLNPAGETPVGTFPDDHTRRAYFTFDLTKFKGTVLHQANFYSSERSVTDCGQVAPIEVWRTKPVTATTTWQKPPRELDLVHQANLGKGTICPGAYLGVDVLTPVTEALARHDKTITFEVRVAAAAERNAAASRTMAQFALSLWANHLATVGSEGLLRPDRPCGTLAKHPSATTYTLLGAQVTDLDPGPSPTTTFAIWPVDHPDQRVTAGTSHGTAPSVTADLSGYPDGTVLAWAAQAGDADDVGPWGKTCYLTVDKTAPAAAPIVSSKKYDVTAYPGSGGQGVSGVFVFDGAGDRDVTGFEYTVGNDGSIPYPTAVPNHPGGRAKVSIAPRDWGTQTVRVRSYDAAGNRSPWQTYSFYVRNTAPFADVNVAGVGLTSHISLHSNAADVTSFGWSVDGGTEVRVPAVNQVGTGEIVFTSVGTKTIVEHAYAGKKLIGAYTQQISVTDEPAVASDQFDFGQNPIAGQPGSFTFTPRTLGVVAYLYDFGDGDTKRIDAAPDGTAVLPWTPEAGGYYTITVRSVDAAGNQSREAQQSFWVVDPHPYVWADPATEVGSPVGVSLQSDLPNVLGFVYRFDGGPEQTVDGLSAYFQVVPTHAGDLPFTAQARLADGSLSPATTIQIHVSSAPLVTLQGPYGPDAVVGREAKFVLKPALPDVASYRYHFDCCEEQTVDAGPDGTATVASTPDYAGYSVLTVTSVGRDGTVSDTREFGYFPADPAVDAFGSTWDDWSPTGGVGVSGTFHFFGDLLDATVKYLWHVNDGPVQEVAPETDGLVTFVPYTPDRTGENILYVQRQFTDGQLSPMTEYHFLVGTQPFVQSALYTASSWHGGPGVTGTFAFGGGMPGVVSFDYQIVDDNTGATALSGTAPADATGAAEVQFTPADPHSYTITVVGHTADGTATDQTSYWFGVLG